MGACQHGCTPTRVISSLCLVYTAARIFINAPADFLYLIPSHTVSLVVLSLSLSLSLTFILFRNIEELFIVKISEFVKMSDDPGMVAHTLIGKLRQEDHLSSESEDSMAA